LPIWEKLPFASGGKGLKKKLKSRTLPIIYPLDPRKVVKKTAPQIQP